MMKFLLGFFLVFSLVFHTYGQDPPKNKNDFFTIEAPAIEYSKPDVEEIMFEDEIQSDMDEGIYFQPERELSIMSEDTSEFFEDESELSVVEVSEEIKMDCVWVTIAEYYSIWDSRSVNPYKVDPSNYRDTISFNLYDTLTNHFYSMPLRSCPITSDFGMRHSRWHYGTDIDLETGDPVLAAFDGIVRINKYDGGGYGNYVMLRHYNGLETLYGHLSRSDVKVGQLVKAGDVIGSGGNTGRSSGSHLHYEVRYEGNAIDPEVIYDFKGYALRNKIFHLTPAHFEYSKSARRVVYHRVKPGDNLGSVSRKYKVSIPTICRLNRISQKSVLKVGQRLRIR